MGEEEGERRREGEEEERRRGEDVEGKFIDRYGAKDAGEGKKRMINDVIGREDRM